MATTCKLIAKQTLGSDTATVTFSDIPGTYTDLLVTSSWRNTGSNAGGCMRMNGDTASNYSYRGLRTNNGTSASSFNSASWVSSFGTVYDELIFFNVVDTNLTADTFASVAIYIPNYAGSTNKSVSIDFAAENNGTATYLGVEAGLWSSTAAITSLSFFSDPGGNSSSVKAGSSFQIYGITKA